jgi:hypothetical protein
MSNDEAEAIMDDFDQWKEDEKRRSFLHRMEHKLNRKRRFNER